MKKKLAILVNIIAPYRVPVLASLAESFDTLVLHGGNESNRHWSVELPPQLNVQKVFTLQIAMRKQCGIDGVSDRTYFHLGIGLPFWLARFRPDVILTTEMGIRTIFALIYGKLARVPVWVWWGGTTHTERRVSQLRAWLRRHLVQHVRHWISYGATSTAYLESIGVRRNEILQIQNCVAHEVFQVVPLKPASWLEKSPRPVILTVGQLIARKGLDRLIEACGRLASRGLRFTLVIVGQGPDKDRIYKLAEAKSLENFVILPNQSQSTLNEIFRSANVFVFPTLEDVWGLVVNEALWAGTPVLCSKFAGCAEELLPQSNIFDPTSPESFDHALQDAFEGTIEPADRSRLIPWQRVAEMMRSSLEQDVPVVPRESPLQTGTSLNY
jgi:glycosyltransferase involved in cell wall biosynthesis